MEDLFVILFSIFLILFVIALLIFGPFATIWALNSLFYLEIPYNFTTWVATTWLLLILRRNSGKN